MTWVLEEEKGGESKGKKKQKKTKKSPPKKSREQQSGLGFVVHSFRPAEGIVESRLIRQRTGDTDSCLDALEVNQRHHLPQSHVGCESGQPTRGTLSETEMTRGGKTFDLV